MAEFTRNPNQAVLPRETVLWVLGILAVICAAALPRYVRAKGSEHWPTADGVITGSWLRVSSGRSAPVYHAEIEFRYRVGSTEYQSKKVSLGFEHAQSRRGAEAVLDRYLTGEAVKVYFDPGDPSVGILEPGLDDEGNLLYKMDLLMIGAFVWASVVVTIWVRNPHDR